MPVEAGNGGNVDEAGVAHIKPYALKNEACTDAELFELLGVAQP